MECDHHVRQVPLLSDEEVIHLFVPSDGIVSCAPATGELLAMTNLRLICFTNNEDEASVTTVPFDNIHGASITAKKRDAKPLYQGVGLCILGILIYLAFGTFMSTFASGITVGGILGGSVAFLGLITIGRFLTWEKGGEIIFHLVNHEIRFPYHRTAPEGSVYQLIHLYLQRCSRTRNGMPLLDTPPVHHSVAIPCHTSSSPVDEPITSAGTDAPINQNPNLDLGPNQDPHQPL